MKKIKDIICYLFHSGSCYDGAYHCSSCDYIDIYSKEGKMKENKRYKIYLRLEDRDDNATVTVEYETNDFWSIVHDLRDHADTIENTNGQIIEDIDL